MTGAAGGGKGCGVIPPPPPSPGADGLIRGCWVARDAQCSTVLFPVGISHVHVGERWMTVTLQRCRTAVRGERLLRRLWQLWGVQRPCRQGCSRSAAQHDFIAS